MGPRRRGAQVLLRVSGFLGGLFSEDFLWCSLGFLKASFVLGLRRLEAERPRVVAGSSSDFRSCGSSFCPAGGGTKPLTKQKTFGQGSMYL